MECHGYMTTKTTKARYPRGPGEQVYTSSIHVIDFIDLKLLVQLKILFMELCVCRPERPEKAGH